MTTTSKRFFVLIVVSFCLFSQINTGTIATTTPPPGIIPPIDSDCCENDAIYVSGNSQITLNPDITILTITVKECGQDYECAVKKLKDVVCEIEEKIDGLDLPKNKIKAKKPKLPIQFITDCCQLFDSKAGPARLLGGSDVSVRQVLVFELKFTQPCDIAVILDALQCFDQIQCIEVTYDMKDCNLPLDEARNKALKDAKNKAKALAKKNDKKLGKLLTIIDETSSVDITKIDWKRSWFTGKTIPKDDITPEYYELEYAITLKYALECAK